MWKAYATTLPLWLLAACPPDEGARTEITAEQSVIRFDHPAFRPAYPNASADYARYDFPRFGAVTYSAFFGSYLGMAAVDYRPVRSPVSGVGDPIETLAESFGDSPADAPIVASGTIGDGAVEWLAFDRLPRDDRPMTTHCLGVRRITINAERGIQPASSVLTAIECRYHPIRFVEQDARLLIDAVRIESQARRRDLPSVTARPAAPPAPP